MMSELPSSYVEIVKIHSTWEVYEDIWNPAELIQLIFVHLLYHVFGDLKCLHVSLLLPTLRKDLLYIEKSGP